MKKILITGAAGFLGSHLCDRFIKEGYYVINKQKEEVAIQIMAIIGQRFYANSTPVTVNDLVNVLHLPQQSIEQQLRLFVEHGLLVNVESDELAYTPARPLEELTLKSVVDTVREPSPNSYFKSSLSANISAIHKILSKVDESLEQVLGSKTVKDIVNELDVTDDKPSGDKLVGGAVTHISQAEKRALDRLD